MQETRMHPSAQTLCGISSHVLADILTALKFFGERTGDCGELKNKTFTRQARRIVPKRFIAASRTPPWLPSG